MPHSMSLSDFIEKTEWDIYDILWTPKMPPKVAVFITEKFLEDAQLLIHDEENTRKFLTSVYRDLGPFSVKYVLTDMNHRTWIRFHSVNASKKTDRNILAWISTDSAKDYIPIRREGNNFQDEGENFPKKVTESGLSLTKPLERRSQKTPKEERHKQPLVKASVRWEKTLKKSPALTTATNPTGNPLPQTKPLHSPQQPKCLGEQVAHDAEDDDWVKAEAEIEAADLDTVEDDWLTL